MAPVDEGRLAAELARAPGALGLTLRKLARERGARVLLFVDQLEEVFTLVAEAETRGRFLEGLMLAADDAADPLRVCFTIRDDFFGHLGERAAIRAAVSRVTVVRSPG